MISLPERRRAIQHLLDLQRPADARAAYYAFDHPDARTTLVTYKPETARASGYICLSRTGLDLFRPLVTLRLPWGDMETCTALIYQALPIGASVIISTPTLYYPLLQALFAIHAEQETLLLALDRGRYEPVINVLVTTDRTPDGTVRAVIRRGDQVGASASINWQSERFAEINVQTQTGLRRQGWGRSVTAALCGHLLENGRTPLYAVGVDNQPSLDLARSAGFIDTGHREYLLEATLQPAP